MPTYEYRCQDCSASVEVVQSFSDSPLTVCQVCGGRLRRVFHPVGIVLKGSGFYSTNNRAGRRPPKPKEPAKTSSEKSERSTGAASETSSGSSGSSSKKGGSNGSGRSGSSSAQAS